MEQNIPVEKKVCVACGLEKRIKSFNVYGRGKRSRVCSICKLKGKTIPDREYKVKKETKESLLKLQSVDKDDYIATYKFLESIGYSLDKDIHEQFCKKYNLTPNSPKELFDNYFSPKQLELI